MPTSSRMLRPGLPQQAALLVLPSTVLAATLLMALLNDVQAAQAAPPPDAQAILAQSDRARGGGLPGIAWDVKAETIGGADDPAATSEMRLRVLANDRNSVTTTLEPVRQKGSRMLNVDRMLWLTRPGLKKPVPISPRQRMTGQAAVGDIAATNYVQDYAVSIDRQEACGNTQCWVLNLKAKAKNTTYDGVTYWVTVDNHVAHKAEFNSVSGKLLKSAEFEYGNVIVFNGQRLPFVSRMVIRDAMSSTTTTLSYANVRVQPIPASEFDVGHLD